MGADRRLLRFASQSAHARDVAHEGNWRTPHGVSHYHGRSFIRSELEKAAEQADCREPTRDQQDSTRLQRTPFGRQRSAHCRRFINAEVMGRGAERTMKRLGEGSMGCRNLTD